MTRGRKRNASITSEESSAKRGRNQNSGEFSPSGTSAPGTPGLSDVSAGLRRLTMWDVLSGRAVGPKVEIYGGLIVKPITPPNPNLPEVVAHPDYIAFKKKLDAIARPGFPITLSNEHHPDKPSPPLSFEFIDYLRLGPGVEEWDDGFSTSCDCSKGNCRSGKVCSCLRDLDDQQTATRYDKDGLLFDEGTDRAIFECNPNCGCGPECNNHTVGRGRQVPIDVFMTENKGWGKLAPLFNPEYLIANCSIFRSPLADCPQGGNFYRKVHR